MKPTRLIAGLIPGLLFAILAVPLIAQPIRESHQFYDITKEVTLRGTVADVMTEAPAGTMIGPHLMLETRSGRVDASLGKWAFAGKGAVSIGAGQEVEVTGVMKTIRNREVFVVRTVKANGRYYTIRNAHGLPVSPQSRERASEKTAQKGESL